MKADENSTSKGILSKIYLNTNHLFTNMVLAISLSGGFIASLAGYILWDFISEWFAFLAIPFTIIFIVALFFTILRVIYSRREKTRKYVLKEEVKNLTNELILTRAKNKTTTTIILLIITLFFIILSIVLMVAIGSPLLLIWLVPAIFPGFFAFLGFKQIKTLRTEIIRRKIQ